jgi:hypothetical protein
MSHFSLDRINSSHLWNRTFNRIHPASGTEQHSIERIQLLEQNIQSNTSSLSNKTTFSRTHPASGTEQHSIEHLQLLEQNNIQSNTSNFWNRPTFNRTHTASGTENSIEHIRLLEQNNIQSNTSDFWSRTTFNRTHPTSGTEQHSIEHIQPLKHNTHFHIPYLRNIFGIYETTRCHIPEDRNLNRHLNLHLLYNPLTVLILKHEMLKIQSEFTFHVLTAFPVTPTPIHCETYRLTIRFRCICATCKSFLQMSRLQY